MRRINTALLRAFAVYLIAGAAALLLTALFNDAVPWEVPVGGAALLIAGFWLLLRRAPRASTSQETAAADSLSLSNAYYLGTVYQGPTLLTPTQTAEHSLTVDRDLDAEFTALPSAPEHPGG